MSAFLLSIHVLAAVLTIGPVAIAASMFPPAARAALTDPGRGDAARLLHRITRVYAVVGVLVPVFGLATGAALGVLREAWLVVAMILTAAAAAILIGSVLPGQQRALRGFAQERSAPSGVAVTGVDALTRRLAMHTGVFNLLWAVVTVLMIYRPGSTTGVGL